MKKKFYITTSIPYANAEPHIGFALEAIQADVLARYYRSLKKQVFFLTGTDEHGIKIKKAAEKKGKDPQSFVDEIADKFKDLAEILDISNDGFIRTTDEKKHKPAVEKVWKELEKAGDIYKKSYQGYYCSGCEAFITEKDLKDGLCPNHKKKPELIKEENYFFKLSKYLSEIKKRIEANKIKIVPETRKNEVLGYIKTGMEDISFSRSKEKYWGFQVPGDEEQIIYVWGDALPNYISAIGYEKETKQFKELWPADVHCIGKDILKFHAIIWPAMLLSLKLPLPKTIFVHGFISVNGQKMSKSLGNVISPFDLVKKYGTDAVRYYLLREIPSTEDGDFSLEKFEARYNSDLASGLGNLVSRVSAMVKKQKIKPGKAIKGKELQKQIKTTESDYEKALKEFRFNEALKSIWELISFCDKHIEKNRPWEGKSEDVLSDLLLTLDKIAVLLDPLLTKTSKSIRMKTAQPLFPRI